MHVWVLLCIEEDDLSYKEAKSIAQNLIYTFSSFDYPEYDVRKEYPAEKVYDILYPKNKRLSKSAKRLAIQCIDDDKISNVLEDNFLSSDEIKNISEKYALHDPGSEMTRPIFHKSDSGLTIVGEAKLYFTNDDAIWDYGTLLSEISSFKHRDELFDPEEVNKEDLIEKFEYICFSSDDSCVSNLELDDDKDLIERIKNATYRLIADVHI